MTTETKTKNTPATGSDNKAVFGPLGKYAIVAVIMVSIIVTTAIMLDRQLNTVDEHIAIIENDVAKMYDTVETSQDDVETVEVTADVEAPVVNTATSAINDTKSVTVDSATVDTETTEVIAELPTSNQQDVTTPATVQVTTAQSTTTQGTVDTSGFEMTGIESIQIARAQQDQKRQARIKSLKLEQKQRMADVFARIKALEAQQLNHYKANQDTQIDQLRSQVARQQEMIEALILRNKDLFNLRAASVQRSQSNREKVLNRI